MTKQEKLFEHAKKVAFFELIEEKIGSVNPSDTEMEKLLSEGIGICVDILLGSYKKEQSFPISNEKWVCELEKLIKKHHKAVDKELHAQPEVPGIIAQNKS